MRGLNRQPVNNSFVNFLNPKLCMHLTFAKTRSLRLGAAVGINLLAVALAPSAQAQTPSGENLLDYLRQDYLRQSEEGEHSLGAAGMAEAAIVSSFPSLGSAVFDAQLAGYLTYVDTYGTPDILIVGSSRALQGIDPEALRYRLTGQGYADLRVYNFSVNGATAQVVNFILGELLPGELPPVIVWGDGSRAFNDGRRDRTWESVTASAGYQALLRGETPALAMANEPGANEPGIDEMSIHEIFAGAGSSSEMNTSDSAVERAASLVSLDGEATLNALGFSAVSDRFNPTTYYQQFPKVNGQFDGAYSPFSLEGVQTVALAEAAAAVRRRNARLIFVNLPLSDSYLDDVRLYYEAQFQQFLQTQSTQHGFEVVDLLTQWQDQPSLFADPSHINQHGAAEIALQLARDSHLLGALSLAIDTPAAVESPSEPSVPGEPPTTNYPTLEQLLEGLPTSTR